MIVKIRFLHFVMRGDLRSTITDVRKLNRATNRSLPWRVPLAVPGEGVQNQRQHLPGAGPEISLSRRPLHTQDEWRGFRHHS